MASYYNLEKTAEILKMSPAEVNRIREKGDIRAFRDGSNWKFLKENVEDYYTEIIKMRQAGSASSNEDDNDLLASGSEHELPTILADSASFDALLSGSLSPDSNELLLNDPLSDDLVVSNADITDSPFAINDDIIPLENELEHDFLSLDAPQEDDGLVIADESEDIFGIASDNVSDTNEASSKNTAQVNNNVAVALTGGGSSSGIDLASDSMFDEDLIIGGSGSGGSGINLAGDSGISLLDAAADSGFSLGDAAGGSDAILELAADADILALVDSDVDPDTATVLGAEDDFQLQADDDLFMTDDSESSSQVIALDGELAEEISAYSLAEEPSVSKAEAPSVAKKAPSKTPSQAKKPAAPKADDDLFFSEDDSAVGSAVGGSDMFSEPSDAESSPFGALDSSSQLGGFGSADASGFGEAGGFDGLSAAGSDPMVTPTATAASRGNEPQFSGPWVAFLAVMVLVLSLSGCLMFELIRCMWSWSEPFTINSTILGLLGMK